MTDIASLYIGRRLFAMILALIGLVLLAGGAVLINLGGSSYYMGAGLLTCASGILLWLGDRRAAWLYAALLTVTLCWSLWEVGSAPWPLVPRLVAPFVLGFGFLLPATWRGVRPPTAAHQDSPLRRLSGWYILPIALAAAFKIGLVLHALGPAEPVDPIYQAGTQSGALVDAKGAPADQRGPGDGDWQNYGNDPGGSRFSPLSQLTAQTVKRLEPVWEIHLGPNKDGKFANLEGTPLKIGGSLYACTGYNDVLAVDAETGHVNWRFHSNVDLASTPHAACRGLAYYAVPGATGPCAQRIYTNTVDARLIALDTASGKPCPGFGDEGQVNLLKGMSAAPKGFYYVSSAPTLIRGRIVLGGWVSDGQFWGEPSGVIRAFDAVTGRLAWAFDMGRPHDHGEPKAGETYTPSTPNSWGPMSADEALGLVYVPTGNSVPDYYGAQRRPFDERYTDAVVAIDAMTGEPRWSYQTLRHDLWDLDLGSQPTLADIPSPHGVQHALIQPTKRGEIFILDRATGIPLSPVADLAVPQRGKVATERLAPTQPFSVGMPSFRGPLLREADMWGTTPLDQLWCRIQFRKARYDGPLTPPGLTPNISYPGYLGGIDWGGVSIDRDRHLLIVNSNRLANYDQLLTRAQAEARGVKSTAGGGHGDTGGAVPQSGTPYAADIQVFMSPMATPCNAPPYGLISAVDLVSHKLVWSHPLGAAKDSGPLGIPMMLPFDMGLPNSGGSLTTRGGLIFIGAAAEHTLRAFDVRNGKEVWSTRLPAGAHATPMSYWSDKSGRQFVVIMASGNTILRSKLGDSMIAYALPKGAFPRTEHP